mmetsp:Transcript_67552/g.162178  ORF Transcript_67552/g.162178 Transcript_67552/m.162178 type:complete len:596 (+) Transcript_67552:133-1920(+)
MTVDYAANLRGAEEVVGNVVDVILTGGGHILFQKYLERKAFIFAADTACQAVSSSMQMCFVAHDQGEDDLDEDWRLDEEPEPSSIDCWARMHLQVRKPRTKEELMREGKQKAEQQKEKEQRKTQSIATGPKAGRFDSPGKKKNAKERMEARSAAIVEEAAVDEEEERYREQKVLEAQQKREKEVKAKETERLQHEETKRSEAMAEEMSRRPHTYDVDGNIIWIEEVKPERLPKVQELFGYGVKRDHRKTDPDASPKKDADKRKSMARRKKGGKDRGAEDFTDSFSKLQHGQPPIMDTMNVKPGVVLEQQGKVKAGAGRESGRQMSRKEYIQMAEREVPSFNAARGGSQGDGEGEDGEGERSRPPTATGQPAEQASISVQPPEQTAAPTIAAQSGSQDAGGSLPKLDAGRGPAAATDQSGANAPNRQRILNKSGVAASPAPSARDGPRLAMNSPNSTSNNKGEVQKAPVAPAPYLRNQKFDSLGYVARPPRYHVPPLGGPFGAGAPQPPLGATMGHGLLRDRSLKEAYFFPSPSPDMSSPLLRSASEVIRPTSGASPLYGGAKQAADHGRIIPDDRTNAYRSVRHILGGDREDGGM